MNTGKARTSRRAFVLNGGATLGAGVAAAASAGAAALPGGDTTGEQLARAQDVDAIRRVHAGFIAAVESTARAGAVATHRAYRANARQSEDTVDFNTDRRHATGHWHVDVQVATPLDGDSTAAQMARLQGTWGDMHWEAGRLTTRYEKERGIWHMTGVEYNKT